MKVAVEGSRRTPCFCKGRAGKTHEWRIVALLCVKTRREGRSAMRYCSLHWLSYLLFCLWQNEGLKHSKQNLCIWHFPSLLTALPSGYCAIQTHHSLWITKWLPPVRFCHLFHFCVTHLRISVWIIFFHCGESPFIFLFLMSVYVWIFLLVGFFQISSGVHCREALSWNTAAWYKELNNTTNHSLFRTKFGLHCH